MHEIFDEVYERNRSVRLIGIRPSAILADRVQMDMFKRQKKKLNLYRQLAIIKNRFGNVAVTKVCMRPKKEIMVYSLLHFRFLVQTYFSPILCQ